MIIAFASPIVKQGRRELQEVELFCFKKQTVICYNKKTKKKQRWRLLDEFVVLRFSGAA
jgi:hypothetical protein